MRTTVKLLLAAAVAAGSAFVATPQAAADCSQTGPLYHCEWVNGTCVSGGGRVDQRTIYRFDTCP